MESYTKYLKYQRRHRHDGKKAEEREEAVEQKDFDIDEIGFVQIDLFGQKVGHETAWTPAHDPQKCNDQHREGQVKQGQTRVQISETGVYGLINLTQDVLGDLRKR